MAIADSDYKFLYVNVGTNGRISDGGVYAATDISRLLERNKLKIPAPSPISADGTLLPYFLVADEAFPLRTYIMKPFPFRNQTHEQRIYNYRLSRARRVIENAFGIMACRFRVLLQPMMIAPDRAEKVTLACCVLHNYLRTRSPTSTGNVGDVEDTHSHEISLGTWREDSHMTELAKMRGNNATAPAKEQRLYLCNFFSSPEGEVSWQEKMV